MGSEMCIRDSFLQYNKLAQSDTQDQLADIAGLLLAGINLLNHFIKARCGFIRAT